MIPDVTIAYAGGLLITAEHIRHMKDNKSCGYIMMDPRDFLDLTVEDIDARGRIWDEAESLEQYNDWAKEGKNILPPYLWVETEKAPVGKILGHEGRHRAVACIKEDISKMPVFLVLRQNGLSKWRLELDADFNYRHVTAADFPEVFVGEYSPTRIKVVLETWKAIQHD